MTSFPYLIFIFCYILLALVDLRYGLDNDMRKKVRYGCIALFLFFIGLRGFIGTDWYSYYYMFDKIPRFFEGITNYVQEHVGREPGYQFYSSFFKTIIPDYHFFVFVSALIDVLVLDFFLRKYVSYYALGFLVFFVFEGLGLSDLLRNVRGLTFFLLSLPYLEQRKPLPYFSLNLLGLLFHASSLLYLPLYFVLHKAWPRQMLIAIFILGNLFFFAQAGIVKPVILTVTDLLGGKYTILAERYLEGMFGEVSKGLSIGYLERTLTCLLVIGFYDKLLELQASNRLFVNLYMLYFASYFFFADVAVIALRLALLFICSYWVLWPALYQVMIVRFNRRLFLAFIFLFALLKINGITNDPLWRYDNLLWGVQSYEVRAGIFRENLTLPE